MNNEQIIASAAITAGLYTENEVTEILEKEGELPLHSIMGWKQRSPRGYEYRVKKGEHGIETRLWQKRKKKAGTNELSDSQEEIMRDFYLAKTYLFDQSQVELLRIEEG